MNLASVEDSWASVTGGHGLATYAPGMEHMDTLSHFGPGMVPMQAGGRRAVWGWYLVSKQE